VICHGRDLVTLRHISLHRQGALSFCPNRGHNFLGFVCVSTVIDRDRRAGVAKHQRDCASNAARRSGYERHMSFQVYCASSFHRTFL
jgi:hypothetical protein